MNDQNSCKLDTKRVITSYIGINGNTPCRILILSQSLEQDNLSVYHMKIFNIPSKIAANFIFDCLRERLLPYQTLLNTSASFHNENIWVYKVGNVCSSTSTHQ